MSAARAQPVSFIIGRPRGLETSAVQSVLFPVKHWQRSQAVIWLKRHGFKAAPLETIRNYHRARQHPPGYFKAGSLRTVHTSGHPPSSNPRRRRRSRRNPKRLAVDRRELHKAVKLYRKFREAEPEHIGVAKLEVPTVLMQIGPVPYMYYETTHRNGRPILYRHTFAKHARPTLCASPNGKALFLVGGRYDFTADGILDRKERR